MTDLIIEVVPRETRGKNKNRQLRAGGQIPAVVYGAGKDTVNIQMDEKELIDLMRATADHNPLFLLKMAGTKKSRHAMIQDMDVDPISRKVRHVDFIRVLLDEKVKVMVQVEMEGEPVGVKNEGGVLDFITREVEVECLPTDIPGHLTIDISDLHTGQHLEAKDIMIPDGIEMTDDPNRVIVSLAVAKVIEEEVEEDDLLSADIVEPTLIGEEEST